MKKILAIVLAILLVACVRPEKAVDMAVDFDGSDDYIKFTGLPTTGRDKETIAAWVYFDVVAAGSQDTLVASDHSAVTHKGLATAFYGTGDNHWPVIVYSGRDGTRGEWGPTGVPTVSTLYFVAGSYDNSLVTNDAVVYLNGVKQVNNLDTAPTGAIDAITGTASLSGNLSFNGKIFDFKVYNRILSDEEILDLYNSRCHIQTDFGLIFHALLDGASGISSFDGATLTTTNLLVDRIGGAVGTPAGNPIGWGDDILAVCSP